MGKKPIRNGYDAFEARKEDDVLSGRSNYDDFRANAKKESDNFKREIGNLAKESSQQEAETPQQKVEAARKRVQEGLETDVATLKESMVKNFGFDAASLEIGKVSETGEIVISSKNGIAIGKGNDFCVAQNAGGMAVITKTNIKTGASMAMSANSENIDFLKDTVGKMQKLYFEKQRDNFHAVGSESSGPAAFYNSLDFTVKSLQRYQAPQKESIAQFLNEKASGRR